MSNLSKGGGVQVGLSMIEVYSSLYSEFGFVFVCSSAIFNTVKDLKFREGIEIVCLDIRGFGLLSQCRGIYLLRRLEIEHRPIGFLTLFGPTLYRPRCFHVVGFAQGHLIYDDSPYWAIATLSMLLRFRLKRALFREIFKRTADEFHVESQFAKVKLARFLGISEDKIFIANNCPHPIFDVAKQKVIEVGGEGSNFIISVVCAYYPHKNLEILNELSDLIDKNSLDVNVIFYTTLDDMIYKKLFSGSKRVYNVGFVAGKELVRLYDQSDLIFVPSLLEIFPGNFLEAMKREIPILTVDLEYAREICGDAAVYYKPMDAMAAFIEIEGLYSNRELVANLKREGRERLKNFDDSFSRAAKILRNLVRD